MLAYNIGARCTDRGWFSMVRLDNFEVAWPLNCGCWSLSWLNIWHNCYYSFGNLNVRLLDLRGCNCDRLEYRLGLSVSWRINIWCLLCRSFLGSWGWGFLWGWLLFLCYLGCIDFLIGNWGFRLFGYWGYYRCKLFFFGNRGWICLFWRSWYRLSNRGCHWNNRWSDNWSRSLRDWGLWCGCDNSTFLGCWSLLACKLCFLWFFYSWLFHGHCLWLCSVRSCLS